MMSKPRRSLAAARWILAVGLTLLVCVIVVTKLLDRSPSRERNEDATKTGRASTASAPMARPVADDVPPWEAAKRRQQPALPKGAVPASEINPPPPDPNTPVPLPPTEPPNPATNPP